VCVGEKEVKLCFAFHQSTLVCTIAFVFLCYLRVHVIRCVVLLLFCFVISFQLAAPECSAHRCC
jgi:diacylglycerol kinase